MGRILAAGVEWCNQKKFETRSQKTEGLTRKLIKILCDSLSKHKKTLTILIILFILKHE